MATKEIKQSANPTKIAASLILQAIRGGPNKHCTLKTMVDDAMLSKKVPFHFLELYRDGFSSRLSGIAQILKNKGVIRHTGTEGWVLADEATANEIIQNVSVNMRQGVKRITNASTDAKDHAVDQGLASDLQALMELFDEFQDGLEGTGTAVPV